MFIRASRSALALTLALCCTLLATPHAHGQAGLLDLLEEPATENAPGMRIELPLVAADGGTLTSMPIERPLPIDIVVGPGEVSGQVLVTFPQDITQQGAVVVPYSGSPDAETRVRISIAVPDGMPSINVVLEGQDAAGDPVRQRISMGVDGDIGPMFAARFGARLIGVLGDPSVVDAYGGMTGSRDSIQVVRYEGSLSPFRVDELRGFSLFVVEAEAFERWPERSQRTLIAWLRDGGRVMLIGADLQLIEEFMGNMPISIQQNADPSAGIPGLPRDTPDRGVAYSLSPLGADRGWDVIARRGTGAALGTVAKGPVGVGMLVLCSIDPSDAGAFGRGLETAWTNLLGAHSPQIHVVSQAGSFAQAKTGSAGSPRESFAVAEMIDRLAAIDASYMAIIIGIAIVLGGMTLMLGPGDWYLLKRLRALSRSWASALLWIALASALVYLMPTLVADRTARVGRLEVVHIDPESPSRGWMVGMTTAASLKGYSLDLSKVRGAGSWWRGVAGASGSGPGALTVRTLFLAQDPMGSMAPVLPIELADRSIRAYMDAGNTTVNGRVSAEQIGGGFQVSLDGFEGVQGVWIAESSQPIDFVPCSSESEGLWTSRVLTDKDDETFKLIQQARDLPIASSRGEAFDRMSDSPAWIRVVIIAQTDDALSGVGATDVETSTTRIYETVVRLGRAPEDNEG